MSRYDIADYLAVSVETVSRSLTDLKQRGVIRFSGTRTVKIVNRDGLEDSGAPTWPLRQQLPRLEAYASGRQQRMRQ
jgi:hypothetical protein